MQPKTEHQSIRLFENDFLEKLTHVHPIVPLLVWAPVAGYFLWRGLTENSLPLPGLALCAVTAIFVWTITEYVLHRFAAIFVWTITEYVLHRFAFHFPARSKLGKWLVFLFHGNHHHDPKDKTRLVMPPSGSIPIMLVLYYLFSLTVPEIWLGPFTAFFIVGYLIYDYIHYATHHFPMKNPVAKYLKLYHLKHHFSGEEGRYGVSSPLWDKLFGTMGTSN
jgi:sterol desaturase/sphingolipid hydroxylase (fatty acid hydroxylase superfamily)